MLKGKTVVVGVSGGIAVYKACELVSRLKKADANVIVVMTAHATEFVSPLTFESLSGNRVITDLFGQNEWEIEHISLANKANCFVIAPATANIIGKIARGIADDFLSTTILATKCPIIVAPAMNCNMYQNPAFEENLLTLTKRGMTIVEATCGRLACGDVGVGRLADIDIIFNAIVDVLMPKRDYLGKKVLVTAGATIEKVDAVRFITNFSSGKMGVSLANSAINRGAEVTLILGRHSCELPKNCKIINVDTTQQMYEAVMQELEHADIIIKSAAPSDYRVENYQETKHKENVLTLNLVKNVDIAKAVGKIKGDKKLVIFSAETNDLVANATAKLINKSADLVVANDVTKLGAGFNCDTNIVTLIDKSSQTELPCMSKIDLADIILDKIINLK
ncbi:MAG: bifunctional phosphopantothenoylcysteine decarboxylase/phosphopantothenate--cysteine ligase CoaBC [Clostridia bacterium]